MKNFTPRFSIQLAFLFFSFFGINKAFAQPANDLCINAIPLTVNGPCTNGTNVGATTTPATDGATGCWLTAADQTVWFSFTTAATPQTYVITTDNGGTTDTQMKILTSACTGTLAPGTNCNEDGGSVNTVAAAITTSSLAPSTTYYIEVDVYGTGSTGTFCISVATLPDVCANAITLVAGAGCVNGTNTGSTTAGDGAGVGAASCWTGASAYSNSVFYNFVATNDSMTVSFGNGSFITNATGPYAAVYSGTCGSLVQLPATSCVQDGNDINLTGLTVGSTYYVMIDGNSTNTGTFCISVSSSLPGNNNLVPLINYSSCGLNFVQKSARVTSRYTGLAGTGLPCTLAIAGIPATCRSIYKAYLFYETSYTASAPVTSPTVSVTNPTPVVFNYNASLIGRSHQKCWGEMGTASYRTDVTSSITGNGNYIINTSLPANEIDGMTLLIIYKDASATYEGHILIDNGIITINSFAAAVASHTMTGVNACAASTGTSFLIAGDFQFATHTNTATGASSSVPVDNFWNFDQTSTNYTLGQPSIAFTSTSNYVVTSDCFSLVATGAYYQTTTCTTCNLPLTVSITPTQPTCGLNNGSATANPSTGIYAPYTYSWSPGGMTTQTVTGLAPGTYTVTVTDPSGCKTATQTVTMNASTAPTASVSPSSTSICNGNNATLTASGGGTYSWNTGPTTAAITVSPAATTTYTVTVTVATCTATATATVNVTQPGIATFSYTGSPYCQNAANPSPTFSGGGTAGTFTSTAGLVINAATGVVNLAASTAGTYTVTNTVAASGPCPAATATATITITPVPVATFSYTGTPYCQSAANPSPTFSGGGVAGTFSSTAGLVFVSTATGVVNLSASTPGTYTVTNTIAASGGCPSVTATSSITITAPQTATFSYTGSPYCQSAANPSPTFSGGGVAGTFSSTAGLVFVSTATGVVNLSASTPGTYTVTNTIAASGGCPSVTATSSITITAPQAATFSYTGSPYCQSAANPSPTFSGGGVAGTFSSTAGLVFVSTATGVVNLSASTPGTYTVTNTIAASGGCPSVTATSSITITAPQTATFSYTGTPYCQSAANPSPTFSGGGVAGTFSSTAGLVFVNTATGVVNLSASTPGAYTVTNTIAASGGCPSVTATSSITITAPQTATFSYTGTPYCQSAANPSPTFSGGGVAGTFSSTAGLVFISTATGVVNLSASTPGIYTVTNTIAASGGCPSVTATSSITITAPQTATFSYTGTPYCQSATNPSPTFSGGGVAGTFSSTAGLVFISTATGVVNLSASTPGTYTVTNTIAASGGCPSATATSSITINAAPTATFSYTGTPYCQSATNPSPTFSGGGVAGTFSSTAGLVFVSTATGVVNLSASTPGTYTVTNTIAASGGCPSVTATSSITITAPQTATFNYTGTPYCQSATNPSPTFSGGGVAGTFSSTAGLVFVSTATGVVNLSASTPGTYTVTNTIAASSGCPSASASASITINAAPTATFSYTASPYCQSAANPSPTFSGGGVAGTFSSTAGLVFVSTATGVVNLSASTPGTYTVTNTIAASGGCPSVIATASITITAPQAATFSYTASPYCQNASNPSPTFSGGGVAGTFSSTAGLVFVSTATGVVNLSASTAGIYTVTNTIAPSGGCPAITSTASITITPMQNAGFNYPSSTFCQTGTNPVPTITGAVGGTFSSSPAGLVFVSTTTGEINLAGSSLNTYSITYTTAGPCASASSVTVTVTTAPVATFNYSGTPFCQNASNPSPTFSGGGTAGVFSSTAGLVFVSTASGQIDLAASTAGTYTVTNTIAASGGCSAATATASITINPVQNAGFNYSSPTYCATGANPTPTITGVAGGTFTSSPAGLTFVSSSTGEINLAGSALNTYTITYTTPGPCPNSSTASITISNPTSTVMNYNGPYCQSGTDPSPNFAAGASAGTFTVAPGGLIFISASTGQVDLSASTPGTYTITNTIAASGGCPASVDTAAITITAPSTASFSYTASPYCQGAANPSPTFSGGSVAGTFSASSGALIFVSTSTGQVDLAASTPGTYTITNTIPASGGCPAVTATSNITITSPQSATFSYTGTPYCQNATNPSPTFSGGGVAGTFSSTAGLSINSGTGLVDLALSTPGTYIVTNAIAASGGCPVVTATSSITINPVQSAAFNYSSSTFCQSGANPTPTITGTSGGTFTVSPAGLVFVSSSTGEVNLAASGLNTYTITYTTAGPCANSATTSVTITNAPVATFSYTGTPYCQNATNPLPTFSGGGTGGVFSSTAGLVFVSTSTGEIDLTASTAGTYTITNTIAASGGCAAANATASITINAVQNAGFNYSSATFCSSGSNPIPTITGTSGGTFTSSPAGLIFVSSATGEINLASSTLNTYTITYTTAGPCANFSTATVTITNAPAATFSYTGTPYCANGTDPLPTFSGSGTAGVFSTTAGLVFVNTATGEVDLSGSTPGTYTVTNTIAASGGCAAATATSSITINGLQSPAFNYASSTFCQSGTNPIPAITGTAGGTFTSSPAGLVFVSTSTGEIDLAASTLSSYAITYTTPGPCADSGSVSITITNSPAATFSYTGSPYCQNGTNPFPTYSGGGTAGVFSSTAGLVFVNTSTGEVDLTSSTPGTYTVTNTIAASGGCTAVTATATITINTLDNASFNYPASTFCQSGSNPIPAITGVSGGTFTSTPSGLVFVNSSTGEINVASSSINTYTITYTTPGPCTNSSSATISITNSLAATFNYSGTPYCQSGVDPSPTFTGGGSAGTFTSTGGLVINSSTGLVNLGASAPGTYTVTNTVAASGGCPGASATASITITAPQTATFNYTGTPYCQNASDPLPTFTGSGTGGTFASTGGLVINSSNGLVDLSASTAGTYTVTNTIAASGGCPAVTATASITINPLQNAAFNYPTSSYCQSGTDPSPTISGIAGGTFTATPAGLVLNASTGVITLSTSSINTYTITYTTPGPCANTSTTTITIAAPPTASATGTTICEGQTINLSSTGGGTYSWSGPGGFTSTVQNPSISTSAVTNSGLYTVTVTTGGCTATASANVTVNPTPVANAGTDVTIEIGASTTLNASGGTSYIWTPATDLSCTNCATPIATPLATTVYCVTVTNGGCSDSSCVTVTVETPCTGNRDLGVPSAFSPNGDGHNDLFCLQGWGTCMDVFVIYIYDRWGEKVFESSDPAFCWDGHYKGKMLDPAVYVYYINATVVNGETIKKKGNISLLR